MPATPTIGLIVPPADGAVPPEPAQMYADGLIFIARGLGLQRVNTEGYEAVIDRVESVARELAAEGADAVALMGTSLSFYRGKDFNDRLIEAMRIASGRPATTMSRAVLDALAALAARRVAVATAYVDEVNDRLRRFLTDCGITPLSLVALGMDGVDEIHAVDDRALIDLGRRAFDAAPDAEALLISCGGLRTLSVTVPLEEACGVPVVSSATAGAWAAARLAGHSGRTEGYGRLFEL